MEKIKLEIVGMSYSQSQSGAYALILGETDGNRRLPIIIGGFEAQAIAVELEKMKPTRPLTHDLFKNFADHFSVDIKEVIIDQFKHGVFHAKLVCDQAGKVSLIDSRTSDAVALAIRFQCPVYTYESIMSEAGIVMDEKGEGSEETVTKTSSAGEEKGSYTRLTLDELEELLEKAVKSEDFEKASELRDEINRRKADG